MARGASAPCISLSGHGIFPYDSSLQLTKMLAELFPHLIHERLVALAIMRLSSPNLPDHRNRSIHGGGLSHLERAAENGQEAFH